MPTRIKICGITRPQDAELAADLGADALGLNFFAGPRRITLDRAPEILNAIPPLVTPVALTSGPTSKFPQAPSIEEIQVGPATAGRTPLQISTFQYYGFSKIMAENSSGSFAELWTVCRLAPGNLVSQISAHFASLLFRCSTVVIDAAAPGKIGGSGQTVDWHALHDAAMLCMQKELFHRFILAGGLTPDNVADAIRIAKPYAVDVSSGVEAPGQPGVKDPIKLRDFIQAVRGAG